MKKGLVVLLLLGIAAGIGFAAFQTDAIPTLIATIKNRFPNTTEETGISLSGNVEITEVNVGFTLAGRIQELTAAEGQPIQKDAPLASLDHVELESAVEQARATFNEAVSRLEDMKTGARSQEVGAAKAQVTAIEAELTKARKDLQRAEKLYQQRLVPASQLDAAKSAYNAVVARHNQSQEQLSLVREGPTKDAIKATEYRVEQAKAALRASEERLKNTTIFAPMTGIILKKNVEVGEIITQGTPIYTIGDLENPWIKVYVKENKLGVVKLGQPAQVTIDSFPGKIYEGTVTYISPEAEFTPKTIQTQEERVKLVFGVKISVKNINSELKPGMPADVKIALN